MFTRRTRVLHGNVSLDADAAIGSPTTAQLKTTTPCLKHCKTDSMFEALRNSSDTRVFLAPTDRRTPVAADWPSWLRHGSIASWKATVGVLTWKLTRHCRPITLSLSLPWCSSLVYHMIASCIDVGRAATSSPWFRSMYIYFYIGREKRAVDASGWVADPLRKKRSAL